MRTKFQGILMIFAVAIAFAVFGSTNVSAQEAVEVTIEDLRQLRRIAADRDHQEARANEAERQAADWQASAGKWQKLYDAEKDRADRVQGGRIAELQKANEFYREQAEADKQRLGELEFRIRKLKNQRKYWFGAGAAIGGAAGAFGGYKIAQFNF